MKEEEKKFHGFSDDEIRSASMNDSSSERSSIISSMSKEVKKKKKKIKSKTVPGFTLREQTENTSNSESASTELPLLHQSLIGEGKRRWKPS